MKQLNNYCVDIDKYIVKSRRYIGFGAYMSGGLILNIVKTFVLKQGFKNFQIINDYISKINSELNKSGLSDEIKYFENIGHGTVIYENNQMNSVVYKQLEKLYKYMDELQSEIKTLKKKINR